MKKNYASKEKMVVVELISTILVFTFYSLYVYNRYIEGNPDILNDFRFWGKSFLILIPVSIVAAIGVHIVFAIFNTIFTHEEISGLSDERDKLIELKSIRISHWIFITGFMLAMGSLAFGFQPWVMFVVLILSGFIASIVSNIAKLIFYRRGL